MPVYDDMPDLSHLKTVQEFNIEQAALLCVGIDPLDCEDGLGTARNIQHARWKLAWGFSEGMVSAIRRGTLTPIECCAVKRGEEWNEPDRYYQIKPTEHGHEISKGRTIVTRDSLFSWIDAENVDIARKTALPVKIYNHQERASGWNISSSEMVIDVEPEARKQSVPMLPLYEHKSEGLELVEEAIKQFWSTYDENDPATAPTKQEVMTYLKEKSVSNNLAEAVDMVLRPFSVRGVGRRRQTKTNG